MSCPCLQATRTRRAQIPILGSEGGMVPLLSIEAQVQPMVATPRQPARKKHPSASCTAISTQKRLHETLETVVVNVLQAHEACRCATAARLAAPYHFCSSSPRAAASSICSAGSFFSFAFSSSKALSRFVSETSMPPNSAFQLSILASEIPCLQARPAVFAQPHAPSRPQQSALP